jgi:hypothetical protein
MTRHNTDRRIACYFPELVPAHSICDDIHPKGQRSELPARSWRSSQKLSSFRSRCLPTDCPEAGNQLLQNRTAYFGACGESNEFADRLEEQSLWYRLWFGYLLRTKNLRKKSITIKYLLFRRAEHKPDGRLSRHKQYHHKPTANR